MITHIGVANLNISYTH